MTFVTQNNRLTKCFLQQILPSSYMVKPYEIPNEGQFHLRDIREQQGIACLLDLAIHIRARSNGSFPTGGLYTGIHFFAYNIQSFFHEN